MHADTHVGLYVKCLLLFSDFNRTQNRNIKFNENPLGVLILFYVYRWMEKVIIMDTSQGCRQLSHSRCIVLAWVKGNPPPNTALRKGITFSGL
jgi:hypothetical protein